MTSRATGISFCLSVRLALMEHHPLVMDHRRQQLQRASLTLGIPRRLAVSTQVRGDGRRGPPRRLNALASTSSPRVIMGWDSSGLTGFNTVSLGSPTPFRTYSELALGPAPGWGVSDDPQHR